MGNPIGARKDGIFKAISTAPSFNKTPVGSSTPPLPYATIQDLGNSVGTVPTVRFNGKPAYVLDQSTQPSGKGDEPGVAKGVKSGTVTGEVKPVKGSTTVRVGKKAIVRHGDPCTMNGGNNPGIYCTTQMPSVTAPSTQSGSMAGVAPETEEEASFIEKAYEGLHSVAKGYQEKVSKPLHNVAGHAMEKGAVAGVAGRGAAMVGGGMVLTGIGAAPGAVIAAGGGAVATVGTGVAAAGGVAETVATSADAAASFIVNGKAPNLSAIATAYIERVAWNKIDSVVGKIPGMKGKVKELVDDVKESINKPTKKKGAPKAADKKPGPAGDGTKIKGDGREGGRCKLRPYKVNDGNCPGGDTPHHVVPDHCFRPIGQKAPYPWGISHADGLTICVSGPKKRSTPDGGTTSRGKGENLRSLFRRLAEHGQAHLIMDVAEAALGAAGDPVCTARLDAIEKAGARAAAQVSGCDKNDLERQLREYHKEKGLDPDVLVRADPFGKIKVDASKIGPRGDEGPAPLD